MPLNIDFQQVLLHLLNFVILFGALYFLLYGPVKKFMEQRENAYKEMDEAAKRRLADADAAKEEYAKKLSDCDAEIADKKHSAEVQSELEAKAVIEKAQLEAENIIVKAQLDAKREHDELIKSARQEVVNAAKTMAENIVNQSTSDTYDQFISSAERSGGND